MEIFFHFPHVVMEWYLIKAQGQFTFTAISYLKLPIFKSCADIQTSNMNLRRKFVWGQAA